MAYHNELGTKGENAAADFLLQNGHTILSRNYRYGNCEIDVISNDKDVIVFTEVKTRSTDYFGYPEEAVDKKKRGKMRSAAGEFMYQNKLSNPVRFDIISIINTKDTFKVYHIKDAFFNEAEDIGNYF